MTQFTTAKEAKRALYEESLRTKVKVSDMLNKAELHKRLREHPILADVLAYFASDAWRKEKASADAELLKFGETCEEVAKVKAEIDATKAWYMDHPFKLTPLEVSSDSQTVSKSVSWGEGRSRTISISRTVSQGISRSEGRSTSESSGVSVGKTVSESDVDYIAKMFKYGDVYLTPLITSDEAARDLIEAELRRRGHDISELEVLRRLRRWVRNLIEAQRTATLNIPDALAILNPADPRHEELFQRAVPRLSPKALTEFNKLRAADPIRREHMTECVVNFLRGMQRPDAA
jgi:hypothetical protein